MAANLKRQKAELRETGGQDTGRSAVEKNKIGWERGPQITYVPREDATPEGELSALAAIYRFIIEGHERNKGLISENEGHDTRSSSSQERCPMEGHDE